MLQYTSVLKKFCLHPNGFDFLDNMRYILWVVALLGTCDVTKHVAMSAAILGFTKN